jgi:hypothetical protein
LLFSYIGADVGECPDDAGEGVLDVVDTTAAAAAVAETEDFVLDWYCERCCISAILRCSAS